MNYVHLHGFRSFKAYKVPVPENLFAKATLALFSRGFLAKSNGAFELCSSRIHLASRHLLHH
jgi:hypothetical protein